MRVLVTGGTGFIGEAMIPALQEKGYEVAVLTRSPSSGVVPQVEYVQDPDALSGPVDAVINLAGASLADKRWSPAYKAEMLESRVGLTRRLGGFFSSQKTRPSVWINASAIGYYGPRGDEPLEEDADTGEGFAAELCRQWENAAVEAAADARLCIMRLGVVLDAGGGAYPQMAQPFKMGVANWIGDGKQWLSWVHRDDVVAAFCYALEHSTMQGPVNVTAPAPVTSRGFCEAMRRVHRTLLAIPMPGFVMRAMVGEMAEELLLTGQKVLPSMLTQAGFAFSYAVIDDALGAIKAS